MFFDSITCYIVYMYKVMLREYQAMVKLFRIIRNDYYSLDELTPKIIKKGKASRGRSRCFKKNKCEKSYIDRNILYEQMKVHFFVELYYLR